MGNTDVQEMPAALRRIIRTIPLALMTLSYACGVAGYELPPGFDQDWLSKLFMLEFLAIHSLPFMLFTIGWKPALAFQRWLRLVGVAFFVWVYSLGAYSMAEWPGVLALLPLMVGTYFGFLLKGIDRELYPELGVRGVMNLICFMLGAIAFDLPSGVDTWVGMRETVSAGLFYFFLLTLAEAMDWPGRLGTKAKTLFESIKAATRSET